MTPKAAFIANIQGIAADQARLVEEERALLVRKRRLADQMRKAIAAFAELEDAPIRESSSIEVDAEYAPRVPGADKGKAESGPAIAARRRYMTAVMEASRSVMLALGHPLTVSEIMAVHPERARISAEAMCKALDLRTRQEHPEFVSLRGCYWVCDRPLPEGWTHPKGIACAIDPESVRKGERTRARRQALIDATEAKLVTKAAMLEEGWVPMRRVRKPGVPKVEPLTGAPRDLGFNVKGLMTSLNYIRASRGEPVVHFESWPRSREDAQAYIDEVRAHRRGQAGGPGCP